ncbi:MAG: hypothetical protein GC168_20460 [Candidatus Hydrogenedens sp.]|nr:hypothetical protein [Candidatus Hydrogenedens sp.]
MKDIGLQNIPVAAIDAGDRLRTIDPAYAQMLADNIDQCGRLRSPIEVRRKGKKDGAYLLIAGGHRLRAFELLGRTEIPAFVYDATDDEARIAEIDENLIRHDLNPLDRASFLFERQAIYLQIHPETAAGVAGGKAKAMLKKDATATLAVAAYAACFAQDVRNKTGLSDRTIQRAVKIYKALAADVRVRLAGSHFAKSQSELEKLGKQPQEAQRKICDLILAKPPGAYSVSEALMSVNGVAKVERSADEIAFDRLIKVWGDASMRTRYEFLRHLAGSAANRKLYYEIAAATTDPDGTDAADAKVESGAESGELAA